MSKTTTAGLVGDYLHRLDAALGPLPRARRQQLVAEIAEHVRQSLAAEGETSDDTVRRVLARVGPPEDIAAAALAEEAGAGRRPSRWIVVGIVAGLVAVGGALGGVYLTAGSPPGATRRPPPHPTTVLVVPDVTGDAQGAATRALQALGLQVTQLAEPSQSVGAGVVVSQDPAAGARVARGQRVTVTVSSGPLPTTATSSAPGGTAPAFPLGVYVDGPPGTPHYYLSVGQAPDGSLSGALHFLYQDGQTSVVFTFTGTVSGDAGTLKPVTIPQDAGSASQDPSTVPGAVSATFGGNTVLLGECTAYLHFATSLQDCTFTYSSKGVR